MKLIKKTYLFIIINFLIVAQLLILVIYLIGWGSISGPMNFLFKSRPSWGYPPAQAHTYTHEGTNIQTIVSKETIVNFTQKPNASKHIFLAGDSNTFGFNLNKNETLDYKMKRILDEYDVHTLAYSGWGASHILERIRKLDLKKLSSGENGFFIYNFAAYQVERVCDEISYFSWSRGLTPYFKKINDEMVFDTLNEKRIIFHKALLKVGLAKIRSFFSANKKEPPFLPSPSSECLAHFRDITSALEKTYKKHFPKGKFIVLVTPLGFENSHFMEAYYERFFTNVSYTVTIPQKYFVETSKKKNLEHADLFQEDGHFTSKYWDVLIPVYLKLLK